MVSLFAGASPSGVSLSTLKYCTKQFKLNVALDPVLSALKQVQVSTRRIEYERAWEKVKEMQANDAVFEGPVVGINRGGAIVLVEVRVINTSLYLFMLDKYCIQ